jgi:hypothetical protein
MLDFIIIYNYNILQVILVLLLLLIDLVTQFDQK